MNSTTDEANNPLQGAKFGLFKGNETDYTEINALETKTSNSEGIVKFENIPYGDYRIKEIIAPVGYEPSETILEASIRRW